MGYSFVISQTYAYNGEYDGVSCGQCPSSSYECKTSELQCDIVNLDLCVSFGTSIYIGNRDSFDAQCNAFLFSTYLCPMKLSDFNALTKHPPITQEGWIEGSIPQPTAVDCIAESSVRNETQLFAKCMASNNYINFILTLKETLLVLEPFMDADCNNATILQQYEQEYANSIFT